LLLQSHLGLSESRLYEIHWLIIMFSHWLVD
jgi:hypothetical protein